VAFEVDRYLDDYILARDAIGGKVVYGSSYNFIMREDSQNWIALAEYDIESDGSNNTRT
jgi:hypothetical protein